MTKYKKLIPIAAFVVSLALLAYVAIMPTPRDLQPQATEAVTANMDIGNYTPYSESALSQARSRGKSVLFFAATGWCQSCSKLEQEIVNRHTEIPQNVTVLRVDYDHDKATNERYQAHRQHTLVVLDEQGEEITRWVGGDFDEMIERISAF